MEKEHALYDLALDVLQKTMSGKEVDYPEPDKKKRVQDYPYSHGHVELAKWIVDRGWHLWDVKKP